MVAMKNGCYGEWLLRKMVAKENGHKGRWFSKEHDLYEK